MQFGNRLRHGMTVDKSNLETVISDIRARVEKGEIELTIGKPLSGKFKKRFHAHLSQASNESGLSRDYIKSVVLFNALGHTVDGGDPYPFVVQKVKLDEPIYGIEETDLCVPMMTTSDRTNKEMMTAYDALVAWMLVHDIEPNENV